MTRLVVVPGPDEIRLGVEVEGLGAAIEGTLYPPVLKSAARALVPAVAFAGLSLLAPLLDASAAVLSPSVQAGAVEIATPLLDASAAVLAPAVQPGAVEIAAPLLDASAAALTPSVVPGPVALATPLIAAPAALLAPTLTVIPFDPASVFALGERGAWLRPSLAATVMQGSTGTAGAVNSPIGLFLDQSQGMALGSEAVTNGNFASGTSGWGVNSGSLSVANGELVLTGNGGAFPTTSRSVPTVNGGIYALSGTHRLGTALTAANIVAKDSANNANISPIAANITSAPRASTVYFTATASTSFAVAYMSGTPSSGQTAIYDDISIRLVAGNHAKQNTAAARPLLKQDVGSRYYVDHDGVDDKLTISFGTSLGSACTVAYVTASGVTILSGQTIGATYDLPTADWYECLVVNRALTAGETAGVTGYLNGVAGL